MNAHTQGSKLTSAPNPISVADALSYLRTIERRAGAMSEALERFAESAPEPYRSFLLTCSATSENIADQAHAAEAALDG